MGLLLEFGKFIVYFKVIACNFIFFKKIKKERAADIQKVLNSTEERRTSITILFQLTIIVIIFYKN